MKMGKKFNLLAIVTLLVVFVFCTLAYGTKRLPDTTPQGLVKQVLDRVMEIQNDPNLQGHNNRYKRALEIKKVIVQNFDSYAMARKSIGGYWRNVSPGKRKTFSRVFADLFQDSYTRLVLNFLKKEQIDYLGEEINNGHAIVKTAIVRSNDRIMVDYYLKLQKNRWVIEDVVIDGVSIVGNYSSIFKREIARNSFDSLLNKMIIQQKAIKMKLTENKKA